MVTWRTTADTVPLHSVLIVADQSENIEAWDALYRQRNCIVLPESNITDALQSARLIRPSLVLIDLDLPRSDRVSLIKSLRSVSPGPILMLIAAETIDEIVEANQEGADECLVKPISPAVLVVKSMTWLEHSQKKKSAPAMLGVTL
jgi:DNA-binding response OmpR family regulator